MPNECNIFETVLNNKNNISVGSQFLRNHFSGQKRARRRARRLSKFWIFYLCRMFYDQRGMFYIVVKIAFKHASAPPLNLAAIRGYYYCSSRRC